MLSPEYVLLGLLAQKAAHGYDLHRHLTADLGQMWHISLSQVYNILNRLEAQGFIASSEQTQGNAPTRRHFRLTAAGRRRFEAWLNTPTECSGRAIRIEFLSRLYFARAISLSVAEHLIEQQIEKTRADLTRLDGRLNEIPRDHTVNRLGLELRVRQMTSILDWLGECRAAIQPDA
jgi:DNA-binding PadR family transcriptional regulator